MDKNLLKVLLTSVAGRYSRALFEESQRQNLTETVSDNLKKLSLSLREDPILWKGLSSKALNLNQINDLWQQLGKKLELCALTINFMIYLCQVKRLNLCPSIFQIYQFLVDAHQNKRQVFVESSTALSQTERGNLIQALQQIWTNELILTFSTCSILKAGLIIQSYNLRLDISLNSYLSALGTCLENIPISESANIFQTGSKSTI